MASTSIASSASDSDPLAEEQPHPQHPHLDLGAGVSSTLEVTGDVISAIVLVLILLSCAVILLVRAKLPKLEDGHRRNPLRWHKIKRFLYNCCCCGWCFHARYKSMGFDLLNAGTVLRITLIEASSIQRRLGDVYFEVWSEPLEHYPKNSRVHHQAPGSCNLGEEQIDLTWFGDESEVVLQAVQYSAKQQADRALGELRVSRSRVEKYAAESAKRGRDIRSGTRLFDMREVTDKETDFRRMRFKEPGLLDGMMPAVVPQIMATLGKGQGLEVVQQGEKQRLENEIMLLREENMRLTGGRWGSSFGRSSTGDTAPEKRNVLMEVAIRFEIVELSPGTVTESSADKSSFF